MTKNLSILLSSFTFLALILLVIFFVSGCDPINTPIAEEKTHIEFDTIAQGANSSLFKPKEYIITSQEDLQSFWNELNISSTNQLALPEINFSEKMILAVALGEKNTGGFNIEISNIVETSDAINIYYGIATPNATAITTQALTQPFHVISTQTTNKHINFLIE